MVSSLSYFGVSDYDAAIPKISSKGSSVDVRGRLDAEPFSASAVLLFYVIERVFAELLGKNPERSSIDSCALLLYA